MRVSVCIPTYNSAKYLRECIDSVLAQTYGDFELLVSDNASTDSTCDIVRGYIDRRIRLHRLERNMGMAFNFNNAARLAEGKYIKFLCYDDLLEPTCLEKQVDMLDRKPEIVMVTAGMRHIDAAGRILRTVSFLPRETVLRDIDVVAGMLVYGNVIGVPSAVLIRRESLLKAGSFSESFPQAVDVDMWLRLAAIGLVGYHPEVLCGFRVHSNSKTTELRRLGIFREDILRITDYMLQSVFPTPLARRVCLGRVAGSFVKVAFYGLRHGYVKWPLTALWRACQIDPAFAGLLMHQLLFRSGLFGIRAQEGRVLKVCLGRTLRD